MVNDTGDATAKFLKAVASGKVCLLTAITCMDAVLGV